MTHDPDSDAAEIRLRCAVEFAKQAGAETLRWFRQPSLDVERKRDGSPVTAADQAAERLLREEIARQFPDDGILGEEFGETQGSSHYQWVLDPIDGTKSFIGGVPLYTTLVAVLKNNQPLLGVVYAPATEEIVYAVRGGDALYAVGDAPARKVQVSQLAKLAEATFLTTCVKSFEETRTPSGRGVYDELESACRLTRTWGDAYGYLLVATGRAEVMIDPEMSLWDAAALQPIIEAAGGVFTDWQGAATVHSGEAVAANAALADQVVAITRKYCAAPPVA